MDKDFRTNNEGKMTPAPTSSTLRSEYEVQMLVRRSADGDTEAFGELYIIYLDQIYRYVYYQLNDRMTAEDITEEVFIKAWKAVKSCKGREQTFLPWLYRIARNQVIDNLRSRRKSQPIEATVVDDDDNAEQELEKKLESQKLLKMVACLPEQQRQVIILKFIEELDNHEIGQVMGRSQGTIRITQMRALTTLIRLYRAEED
jgi:RNA polymerase sigma-70 factor (ECF subfamily)